MAKNTDKQIIDKLADDFRGYAALLRKIKQRVLIAQQRAIYAANEEMLRMYWDIGGLLQQSQEADGWGKKTLQRLAADLKNDYSEIKGFTVRNMQYMVQFFNEYNFTLPIKHLDWTHNLVLIKQVKDIRARYWYMVHRLHDVLAIDWSMQKQRPHVWPQTTARLGFNDRTIQLQRALQFLGVFTGGIAGYLLELMIEMGETVVAAVVCHLADIDVFVDQQFGCV